MGHENLQTLHRLRVQNGTCALLTVYTKSTLARQLGVRTKQAQVLKPW